MKKASFDQVRSQCLPAIESCLKEFLAYSRTSNSRICSEMSAYHLETGGKRLRALIPCLVYEALGHDPLKAVTLGAAIEMIHNATLVHDDLQDGDEVRRDQPTVWKKYSAAQAINCGDAMFQYAFRLLLQSGIEPSRLVQLMDRASLSTLKVIEGQAQEFLMKDEACPNVARYLTVIRGKTSGLFALPVVGAMEALGMKAEDCRVVEEASVDLGMVFQIQDDILDIYGKKGRGDRIATDIAEGKISIFVAHIYEVGNAEEKASLTQILRRPRDQTTDSHIQSALAIFERHDAKGMASGYIRNLQKSIAEENRLKHLPELRSVLLELGELFLEPLHGIL